MSVTAKVGTGWQISRSGFTFNVISARKEGEEVAIIDATKMSTTVAREKMASSLYDPGRWILEVEWDGTRPTLGGSAVSTTVTFNGSATHTFNSIIASISGEVPLEDKMTATITLEITGEIT